jgi:hypothetical protein
MHNVHFAKCEQVVARNKTVRILSITAPLSLLLVKAVKRIIDINMPPDWDLSLTHQREH